MEFSVASHSLNTGGTSKILTHMLECKNKRSKQLAVTFDQASSWAVIYNLITGIREQELLAQSKGKEKGGYFIMLLLGAYKQTTQNPGTIEVSLSWAIER